MNWNRRNFLKMAGAGVAGTALRGISHAETPEAKPPNVVLIISDDQAYTDYGFMGHKHIQTPNIDNLARRSLTFTRAYVPTALCRPSLATIVSGLYPHQHGATGNSPAGRRAADRRKLIEHFEDITTVPKLLRQKGYLSMQAGKWWEGHYSQGGFTHGMTLGFGNTPGGRHGDMGLAIGREGLDPVFDFIYTAKEQDKPFLLWYAPFMPHTPHNPPKKLLNKYIDKAPTKHVARYWAMCEWFDQTCGELLKYLDSQNIADNTMVIYVCDNGWIQKHNASGYAPRSKRTPYEGGIRTPLMVSWPGHTKAKVDRTTLAGSIDIAPTILNACGLKPTEEMPGVNLLDAEALGKRESICGAVYAHDIADVEHPTRSVKYRWIIRGRWKLIVPYKPNVPNEDIQLYDLCEDPHETRNLADDNPEKAHDLKSQLDQWWRPSRHCDINL